ncbi:MarR family transcriptional regulator [Heliobacterium gestii]|uniref:MarR family transcriptional regulator n=1 Tax=Heliomicrobium gestii TaxID=2699 RepID=A0A845LEP0_HELGE|nr:MarR family transcriptional regulator [Heliomicrobium gestii]MBM7865757.1 DNA-binding MarR family transcriptional regulator [Heliomicrobium gestii]MZP42003.1 MarR family transcriptional regulator [Heliomicrobium gestii]
MDAETVNRDIAKENQQGIQQNDISARGDHTDGASNGEWHEGRKLFRTLQSFYECAMSTVSRISQRTDLTFTQLQIMNHIHFRGLALQKEMRKQFHLTQGALSTALKDLEKRELISRTQSPVDQREWVIALSPQGERLLAEIGQPLYNQLSELVEKHPQQVKQLIDSVEWFTETFSLEEV